MTKVLEMENVARATSCSAHVGVHETKDAECMKSSHTLGVCYVCCDF